MDPRHLLHIPYISSQSDWTFGAVKNLVGHGWFRASEFLDRDVLEISNEGVEKGSFASSDLSDDAQELALFDAEHDVFESDVFRDHDGVGDNAV